MSVLRTLIATSGSSPLARGLHFYSLILAADTGIIPARAGSTYSPAPSGCAARDHPRSRGGYFRRVAFSSTTTGSSPLARGLQDDMVCPRRRWGIIPARAGSTHSVSYWRARVSDHPRSRGVYCSASPVIGADIGSSPLARGLLYYDPNMRTVIGIIPARAGSTAFFSGQSVQLSDHPRSRGVYVPAGGGDEVPGGSSPLARGLLNDLSILVAQERIIPARAGSTATTTTHSWRRSDHPRSRGVYFAASSYICITVGSSPLARGLLHTPEGEALLAGIIPARAGSTGQSVGSP